MEPYGREYVELQHDERRLNAAGALYVRLTEYKPSDVVTPSPLLISTPGDKRSLPVEKRLEDASGFE